MTEVRKILYIVSPCVDAAVAIFFIRAFLNRNKKNLFFAAIAILLACCGITLAGNYFETDVSLCFYAGILAITLSFALFICKKQFFDAILCVTVVSLIRLFSNFIVLFVSRIVSDFGFALILPSPTLLIGEFLIEKVFLISVLIVVLFYKADFSDKITGVIFFSISMLTEICIAATMTAMHYDTEGKVTKALIIQLIVFLLINAGMYLLVIRARKLEKQKYDLKTLNDRNKLQQEKYTEAVGVWNNVRKVQHDIKQHLSVIDGLLRSGKTEECQKYVGDLIPATKSIGKVISSDNAVLDYLINSKLCSLHGAEVIVSGVVGDLSDISNRDLVSIFGNIIDNAMEAVNGLDEKRIELLFSKQDENRIIICKNTINKRVLSEDGKLITTKKDGDSHGLGHLIVEETVARLGGMINYSESGGMFSVQIVLPEQN